MGSVSCTVCGNEAVPLGTKRTFCLYRCRECLHMFVWPAPHNHLDIYCEEYFAGACHGFGYTDYDRDKQPMMPTFREYLRRIEAITPAKGTMLDVGAATGFFLDLARQRDWTV